MESVEREIEIRSGPQALKAILGRPPKARGVVLFAHGSGSGRLSPRNNYVARKLQSASFATVLGDLLTERESSDRQCFFDINLLATRLLECTRWVSREQGLHGLPVGYFGASTGAAAALAAVATDESEIAAVVSRGGRPDLAGHQCLTRVRAPTLLIIGELDKPVISMNKDAFELLAGVKEIAIVPNASHLFEEPGALELVADLAVGWFDRYLVRNLVRT
jgi:putative phosphoribosyl transferase